MNTNSLVLPTLFREALSGAGMRTIDEWWAHLNESSRSEALDLWNDCSQAEHELTVRVEARYADEQEEEVSDFWHNDYYDYLVNHEIYLFEVPGVHICTRHPAAANAVRAGIIPHNFSCPVLSAECPMLRLLSVSPERSLRLRVSLLTTRRMPNDFTAPNARFALQCQYEKHRSGVGEFVGSAS